MKNTILLLVALLVSPLYAGDEDSAQKLNPTWHVSVGEAEYVVAVNSITSACVQDYDMEFNGVSYAVTEFNIETVGGAAARFYYIDEQPGAATGLAPLPAKLPVNVSMASADIQSKLKEVSSLGAGEMSNMDLALKSKDRVTKKYPDATYAKTFEFRMSTKDEVRKLYNSLVKKWLAP